MNVLFTLGRWTWTISVQCLFEQLWHGTDLHHSNWPLEADSPLMVMLIPNPMNFHPPTLITGVPWDKAITGARSASSCASRNIDHSIKCSIICFCTVISITEWPHVISSNRDICFLACIFPPPFGTHLVFYLMVLNWYPWAVSQQNWKVKPGSFK